MITTSSEARVATILADLPFVVAADRDASLAATPRLPVDGSVILAMSNLIR